MYILFYHITSKKWHVYEISDKHTHPSALTRRMGQACFERLPVGSGVKLGDAKESIKLQYISVLFEFL